MNKKGDAHMIGNDWQALALSEHVNAKTPLPVYLAENPIALFRDKDGVARAVEDFCPHRRVPLTLGKIIEGRIRCAYHGWTFDGKSGACTAIPNLSDDESPPKNYSVTTYATCEKNGFVYICLEQRKNEKPPLPFTNTDMRQTSHVGSETMPIGVEAYQSVLLDGPQALFSIHGIGFSDFYLGDPVWQNNILTYDRPADWVKGKKTIEPSKWAHDYPMILRTEFNTIANTTKFTLMNITEDALVTLVLSVTSHPRGTTHIVWRAISHEKAPKRLSGKYFKLDFFTKLDGPTIAGLLLGPSDLLSQSTNSAA